MVRPVGERWAKSAHTARFFGDLVVDVNVKALRRRYGAGRADPRTRGRGRRGVSTPQRRNRTERRSEAVETRRLLKSDQVRLRTIIPGKHTYV